MTGVLDRLGAANLGTLGLWSGGAQLGALSGPDARSAAREIEDLGFGALWIPESTGKEAFAHAAMLLAATERIVVATGIANIWSRDAMAMANGARTLAEAFGGRFLLGIGISHAPTVNRRGHRYDRPLATMREYLDAMEAAAYSGPDPKAPVPVVIGALGPKMLQLAADRTAGAHPYFVPVEHTRMAREVMGYGPLLAPEQAVVLRAAPDAARQIARTHMARYLDLDNYTNNLRRLGWGDYDLADGGSDALVDAIVAWGDVSAVAERVRAHQKAGADHVCVQVFGDEPSDFPLGDITRVREALR